MSWETVIGLEVHVQLNTRSKMFSGAATAFGAPPNTQACAVDCALPGTLPVLNAVAIRKAVLFGLAVEAQIAPLCHFERKNYFYPDLPKGYQISQLAAPILSGGALEIALPEGNRSIPLTRAHLEEDAGRSIHDRFPGFSAIDLNRAGTPLLEVVSEPVLRGAEEASAYLRALHTLVRYLDICDGDMSQGSLRCDVNLSLRRSGERALGVRSEIKNLNSFRFVERAIRYEEQRHRQLLEQGEKPQQETRLYDAERDETRAMRSKESDEDYRYFPEPDLLPVELSDAFVEELRAALPELPRQLRERFAAQYHLGEQVVAQLCEDPAWAHYYEQAVAAQGDPQLSANWMLGELAAYLNRTGTDVRRCPLPAEQLGVLTRRVAEQRISGKIAKSVFEELCRGEQGVDAIIAARGLEQISDSGAIGALVDEVLKECADQVAAYREGAPPKRKKMLGFFVGQVMQRCAGRAQPQEVNRLLRERLGDGSQA